MQTHKFSRSTVKAAAPRNAGFIVEASARASFTVPAVPPRSVRRKRPAKALLRDRPVTAWLALARADGLRVVTSAAALVGVAHPRINRPGLEWLLSRLAAKEVLIPRLPCPSRPPGAPLSHGCA